MFISYKYRLLPTEEHKVKLLNYFGMCRFVYNLGLETKIAAWSSLRVSLSAFDLINQLTILKNTDCQWLKECHVECLHSSLTNLEKAYKSYYKGRGFPNFKKRSDRQSIQFRGRGCRIEGASIKLGKLGFVDFIKHRELTGGEIKSVTVSKATTNKYFVSILIDTKVEPPVKCKVLKETAIGIDVGIKSFAVLSDGTEYESSTFFRDNQKRLRIEQRKMSRRFKRGVKIADQSKSWHKQRLVVALLHEKISNQRSDFLHKISTSIIKKYDTVCLEKLNIVGLSKNPNIAKSISDAGWGQFMSFLQYKAERKGKNISYINRFEPTSKMCSSCGELNNDLKLSDRTWVCSSCGTSHDRDHNAAINIKRLGLEAKPTTANVSQQTKRIGCESHVALSGEDFSLPEPPKP